MTKAELLRQRAELKTSLAKIWQQATRHRRAIHSHPDLLFEDLREIERLAIKGTIEQAVREARE